jgi:serine phosphatase RsbU (regulator of sigma subunit)/pSer/pThr/pTyr-binding forkhead associated (FHA) protein
MAVLMKVSPDPAGQCFELNEDEIVIGRLPECSIVLDAPGVSRRHALIRRQGADHLLSDLRSRNQTKCNEKLLDPEREHPLRSGDRINICDVEFIYYQSVPAGPPPGENDGLVITETDVDSTLHTLDASRSDLLALEVKPEAKLKALLDITRNLSSSLKLDGVAPKILETLLEKVFPQAERAFLVLLKEGDPKQSIRKTYHKDRPSKRPGGRGILGRPAGDETRLSISRSIINHVLGQRRAVLSQDAGNDNNLPTSASIADLKIRSVMCAPLLTPDNVALGILQIDTSDRQQFDQDDLEVLVTVASLAAIAIQNAAMHESLLAQERVARDLNLARQVQISFLPKSVPKLSGYEFFAHYNPAYEVGGDYYDFVPLSENRLGIALGDVSGKGVAAALMMAKFSGDTRFCILAQDDPALAADSLNALLCAAGIDEKFITLSLGILDVTTHNYRLCSAGHLPIMIRRSSGRIEEVGGEVAGFPLGILPNSSYKQIDVSLAAGDIVLIYSDGVTDARNPLEELYDSKDNHRLAKRLADAAGGPEAVGKAILQEIREFSAGHVQADDITLVCFGPVAT